MLFSSRLLHPGVSALCTLRVGAGSFSSSLGSSDSLSPQCSHMQWVWWCAACSHLSPLRHPFFQWLRELKADSSQFSPSLEIAFSWKELFAQYHSPSWGTSQICVCPCPPHDPSSLYKLGEFPTVIPAPEWLGGFAEDFVEIVSQLSSSSELSSKIVCICKPTPKWVFADGSRW